MQISPDEGYDHGRHTVDETSHGDCHRGSKNKQELMDRGIETRRSVAFIALLNDDIWFVRVKLSSIGFSIASAILGGSHDGTPDMV